MGQLVKTGLFSDEYYKSMEGKLVSSVSQRILDGDAGSLVVAWHGETSDGYFAAIMAGGVISFVWVEREYELRYSMTRPKYIACLSSVMNLSKTITDLNQVVITDKIITESKSVKFEDLMEFLGWKYEKDGISVEDINF